MLFSEKNKKNILKCNLLKILPRVLRIKNPYYNVWIIILCQMYLIIALETIFFRRKIINVFCFYFAQKYMASALINTDKQCMEQNCKNNL